MCDVNVCVHSCLSRPNKPLIGLDDLTAASTYVTAPPLDGGVSTTHTFSHVNTDSEPEPDDNKILEARDVMEDEGERNVKATKSGKARVPVAIWRYHLSRITRVTLDMSWETKALPLRQLLKCIWRRSVT